MIPFLPALLLLLMQGSLDGDALEGRVHQLWLARMTGHSTHLDQAAAEEAICALLLGAESKTISFSPCRSESVSQPADQNFSRSALNYSAAPRDGPQA